MKNTQLATAIVNAQADEIARRLDGGTLRLYGGAQPATADTAVSTQPLLVTLNFASPSAPAAINGALTFATLAPTPVAASGTVTWFRTRAADGSPVLDGSADLPENNPNLALSNPAVTAGGLFVLDAISHTVAKATTGL